MQIQNILNTILMKGFIVIYRIAYSRKPTLVSCNMFIVELEAFPKIEFRSYLLNSWRNPSKITIYLNVKRTILLQFSFCDLDLEDKL